MFIQILRNNTKLEFIDEKSIAENVNAAMIRKKLMIRYQSLSFAL
jgi:hypothetical protein